MSKKQRREEPDDLQSQLQDFGVNRPGESWQPATPAVPPAPAKKKNWFLRHKILSGLGALAAIGIVATATSAGGNDASGQATVAPEVTASAQAAPATHPAAAAKDEKPAAEQQKSSTPGIGDPVRDGKFEFTVTKVKRGVASVGADYMAEKAQGSYTLVYLTVKNIGDEGQFFSDDDQKVLDKTGRQFNADTEADIVAGNNNDVLFEQINPGNSIQGVLVFDLPQGVRADSMELHDSMFFGGVKVALH